MEERRGRLRALAAAVPSLVGPALGKRGFGEAQLIAHWAAIVGEDLAETLTPDKITFPRGERRDGTLRLRAAPGAAIEAQHREPVLIERINGFFGYRAVIRLVLVQGPPVRGARPKPPAPRALAAAEQQALDRDLAVIEDPTLRAALQRLGAAVIGSTKR